MADSERTDTAFMRGIIEGYLRGIVEKTTEDTGFDQGHWEELYGERVIYNSVPAWPSEEARRRGDAPVVLCEWDDARDAIYLKEGVTFPTDRPGVVVFAAGIAVLVKAGTPFMVSITESDIEQLRDWAALANQA